MADPDIRFFFVGVGKCGTSWIYEFLRRHDIVSTPSIKEPYLADVGPTRRAALVAQLYSNTTDQPLADFSNVYYWDPENPSKIAAVNPAAKIIVTVRKPSARIISHFGFLKRNGDVAETATLASYIDAGDRLRLVRRSIYRPMLERYLEKFGRDNILLLPLELLNGDPQAYADRLLEFIGAPRRILDGADKAKVLVAARPRVRIIARTTYIVAGWMRARGMLGILGTLKRSQLLNRVLYRAAANRIETDFGTQTSYIAQLDEDYGKLLSDWGAGLPNLIQIRMSQI